VLVFRFTTAVTSVPLTTTVVVVIITASITYPTGRTALAGASVRRRGFSGDGRIETFATSLFVTVRELIFISRCATAVTSVPVAATVIIIVVTTLVLLEVR